MARRSRSFGSVADDYDRYRPGPPPEAVEWVLHDLPRASGRRFCDLAAGTGVLTRALLAHLPAGAAVLAVEPDPRMVDVLVARTPGAAAVQGHGEALPWADASLDGVLVSSAWHWMDEGPTVGEIARVLRPGGLFATVGTGPDRDVDWVGALFDGVRRGGVGGRVPELPPGAPFSPPETALFHAAAPMTRGELVGLAGTYSSVLVLPEAERRRRLAEVDRLAADVVGGAGDGPDAAVEVPVRCRCWRTLRLP